MATKHNKCPTSRKERKKKGESWTKDHCPVKRAKAQLPLSTINVQWAPETKLLNFSHTRIRPGQSHRCVIWTSPSPILCPLLQDVIWGSQWLINTKDCSLLITVAQETKSRVFETHSPTPTISITFQFMVAACTLLKFVPPLCPNHLADTYCTPNLKSCKERWLSGPEPL